MPDAMMMCIDTFGLRPPTISDDLMFTLTRRKEGTEVGLLLAGHWWNLSYLTGTYPPSFRGARQWVTALLIRYGWEATEAPRDWRRL